MTVSTSAAVTTSAPHRTLTAHFCRERCGHVPARWGLCLNVVESLASSVVLVVAVAAAAAVIAIRARRIDLWLSAYARNCLTPRVSSLGCVHLFVCIADHFEPALNQASLAQQRARVDEWIRRYPVLSARHRDADGRPPQHTFFYPAEDYCAEHLDRLAELCRAGFGDVEVHVHHDRDTSAGLRDKLLHFTRTLHERHGLLRRELDGRISYGFIHGNWALDNSHPDGRWCGVNDELRVLRDTGCYADFTFPSAPSPTQTTKINSIYYAVDDPARPKSHDTGVDARVGGGPVGDLLLVQGPLTLDWGARKWGLFPRIENGDLSGDNPPSPRRADLWLRQRIHVVGRPEWVFIKLHTHGADERNVEALLGPSMDQTLTYLERTFNDGTRFRLHYVTAREMVDVIRAAESDASLPTFDRPGPDATL